MTMDSVQRLNRRVDARSRYHECLCFVANPDRNAVTRIEVATLNVMTAEVGVNPVLVETSSDYRVAVTFNQGSNSLSVIDSQSLSVQEVRCVGISTI